ncbi:MAG: VOC family protein [Bryobacteraceae bacterium]
MTTFKREGFTTATPTIFTTQPDALLDFVEAAFGARATHRNHAPGGGFHGGAQVGSSMLRVNGGAMAAGREVRASLHYFVDDVDEAYRRAIAAGAKVMMGEVGEPADRPYGERSAFVDDPFGNQWFLGKYLGPDGAATGELRSHLYPKSARGLISFLEKTFGAQSLAVHANEGRVMHAQVKIGDSVIEMGEGDGFPQAVSLYLEDPDGAYERALALGATSISAPADQPHGERTAAFVDPFGNRWYAARRLV